MKALIRHNSDPILETMNIPSINWDTGAPLTNSDWYGGPYILVDDYVPEDPADDFDPTPAGRKAKGAVQAPPAQEPAAAPVTEDTVQDTIVIDGVTYTRTS